MYPYLRLAKVIATALLGQPIELDGVSRLQFLVWPLDIDIYPEMNDGRHLTIMDLGRADFAIRSGILKAGRERGWSLVAAGASVRFRHRLAPLRRFTLATRLLGRDDRWFYFLHETVQSVRTCSSALVRAGLRSKDGLVPAKEVIGAAGMPEWSPELPAWVRTWIEAEELRPKE